MIQSGIEAGKEVLFPQQSSGAAECVRIPQSLRFPVWRNVLGWPLHRDDIVRDDGNVDTASDT
ncbi:hypothetical protein, partial [Longimicrobium sp.]|uniref:hypothetical protein n=1 Tax=Longimicrobium sp. TaxID=2029185 RepID=UPI002F9497A6